MPAAATLPYSWYTDAEILRREHEQIFRRAWHYVGHEGQLAAAPSYFTGRAADVPVLVTRDAEGAVRAFLNVCRHRGAVLADGPGRRETVQCAYHAWTYGLDGRLRRAPRAEAELDLAGEDAALLPLRLETWGPFVFVNADAEAPPLAETLGALPELVARVGVDVGELRFRHRATSTYAANWKICCENFLECYHCAVAHPGFSGVIDVREDVYALEATEASFSTQYAPVRADADTAAFDPRGPVARGQFHLLWPNVTINIFPGRPNLSIGPVLPESPERTSRFLDYFFAPAADEAWIEEMLRWDDEVGAQDLQLVERVQRGVRCGLLERGLLLPAAERLVNDFDEKVVRALARGGAPAANGAPADG